VNVVDLDEDLVKVNENLNERIEDLEKDLVNWNEVKIKLRKT